MGHQRLGGLPVTQPWKKVVRLIADGADVAKVADATLEAAQRALSAAQNDPGFREAVHLMVQLALAGTTKDAAAHLAAAGVELADGGSVADLAAGLAEALDRRMEGKGQRSDWGEMAKGALVATVSEFLTAQGMPLFDAKREDLTAQLGPLHREKEFSAFGRKFFGRLTGDFLDYFLSKTLGTEVGAGHRFVTTNQVAQFRDGMRKHCGEASQIVESFCGEWLSKHRLEENGNISRESAEGFGWNAVRKMQLELAERNKPDGN